MIDPAWQSQGIATGMLYHIIQALSDEENTTLRSRKASSNEPSREWHHRMGFINP
ncbi:MAG: GNAT family N-acetyltransferase [Verrucomicrobiales bacterium]|jgi:L-amino acid N-acyltransferase YncA|nr:GNAT family N-acetyltransferase [Verrucomicrobiales bacterium]